jgi:hypothetical protein
MTIVVLNVSGIAISDLHGVETVVHQKNTFVTIRIANRGGAMRNHVLIVTLLTNRRKKRTIRGVGGLRRVS